MARNEMDGLDWIEMILVDGSMMNIEYGGIVSGFDSLFDSNQVKYNKDTWSRVNQKPARRRTHISRVISPSIPFNDEPSLSLSWNQVSIEIYMQKNVWIMGNMKKIDVLN